jgi:hypothetical protein
MILEIQEVGSRQRYSDSSVQVHVVGGVSSEYILQAWLARGGGSFV